MLKSAAFIVFILLFSSAVYAQRACTITMNPDYTTVHDFFVNDIPRAPVNGDVVCFNAGSVTYTSAVDITKGATIGVEIRGAGAFNSRGSDNQTIFTNHTGYQGTVFYGNENAAGTYNPTIDNVTFVADSSTGATAAHILVQAAGGVGLPFIFHHITFNDFMSDADTGCSVEDLWINTGHGVAYRNIFNAAALSGCGYGFTNVIALDITAAVGDTDGKIASWQSLATFGSADGTGVNQKNFYFENSEVHGHLIDDIKESARVVFRFNDVYNGTLGSHGHDSGYTGARHSETYNNTIACDSTGMGHATSMSNWISQRGGTGNIFNNIFPATDISHCSAGGSTVPAVVVQQYKLDQECIAGIGWPGGSSAAYPTGTYPSAHLPGWGWLTGATTVGASTTQDDPGLHTSAMYDGFTQDLEPILLWGNTNNTGAALMTIHPTIGGACRAMAYSNQSKASDTKLVVPSASSQGNPFVNAGQDVAFFFADLVGGTAPTIADNCNGGQTWTATTGGTNSGMRLSGWTAHFNATCNVTVTITHDSSSAARAGTLIVMRGLSASPKDKNPAVATDNSSTYTGPSSGTLTQAEEFVLGYFALAAPITDTISATGGYTEAISCQLCSSSTGTGFQGTTGGSDVSVAVAYLSNTGSTTAVTPTITNATSPTANGIAGTITFKVNGSASTAVTSPLDLSSSDFIVSDREYYTQSSGIQTNATTPFNGTTGTGWGTRANRPTTCTTGVVYWSTDQGSWNTLGADGVLDKCESTNTWTNSWYVPLTYPHPLADVTTSSCTPDHLAFIGQPSNAVLGAVLGTVSVGIYDSGDVLCTAETSTIIITNSGGTCTGMTLGGTSTGDAVAGVFTTTNLTESVATGACTIKGSFGALTDGTSSSFTISAAVQGTGGGIGSRLKLNVR